MKAMMFGVVSALALTGLAHAQVTSDEYDNTGMGTGALGGSINSACQIGQSSSSKCYNTAAGYAALGSIKTGGNYNTGTGFVVLYQNTSGYYNTATGAGALEQNTTGESNTAIGFGALSSNILGNNETRSTGSYNTASGAQSLYLNTTGSDNTASGFSALYSNTVGEYNTASGYEALFSNSNGYSNVSSGYEALYANTDGNDNTATGTNALRYNTTGSNNSAFGFHAGANLTTGSNNIDVGSPGAAGDANTIKIGVEGTQTATYIAGIYGHSLTGSAVVVTSSGELGVVASSERFKTGIASMGTDTANLGQLRPVTFKLKADPTGTRQYGLIAEEVAKVYPELVIRNSDGRIDGVRYDELAPMLLNEVQKQAAEIRALKVQMRAVKEMHSELRELHAALANKQGKEALVADR